ncbi:hypothetical protein [Nocardioides alcanivorans]|uniref:hypothetical protein n=1 Tax=Nocardioides alcanivorans TaxID=2897352 RepID=UPI001F2EE638|nr:hypothetical protein [Nocardioides alcanivorans]
MNVPDSFPRDLRQVREPARPLAIGDATVEPGLRMIPREAERRRRDQVVAILASALGRDPERDARCRESLEALGHVEQAATGTAPE